MSVCPPNFSWAVEGLLAVMAFPSHPEHLQYLRDLQISHLVSLTEERTPAVETQPDLKWTHMKIIDFTPPSIDQIEAFVNIVTECKEKNEKVAVHCAMGRGRAGTMAACYLLRHHRMTSVDAIQMIRRLRPGSIETEEQEQAVHSYAQHIGFSTGLPTGATGQGSRLAR